MKKLIIALCLVIAGLIHYAVTLYPSVKILHKTVDDRGLISVQFKYGRDTMAYDYLTQAEFEVFVKTGDPYSN